MPKKSRTKSDRTDPRQNKSLAIRNVLEQMPNAKAQDVVAGVKKEFGHDISLNRVYMVKTKMNMASDGRPRKTKAARSAKSAGPMNSAATWVEAIKLARQLLKATGSVADATALLKAVDA